MRWAILAMALVGLEATTVEAQAERAASVERAASLERAERQLEEAQFERAAETLAVIADGEGPLDRDGVARLLRLRAVVGLALGREQAVARDVRALAAVLGGREPGPMPDALMRELDAARAEVTGPPTLRVRIEDANGARRAVLQLSADPGALVRGTRVICESDGVEVARTEATEVDLPSEGSVACRAEAFGPGGWVLDTAEARRAGGSATGAGGGGDDPLPWILGGIGAAVLVAVIIGIAVGVSGSSGVGGPEWVP